MKNVIGFISFLIPSLGGVTTFDGGPPEPRTPPQGDLEVSQTWEPGPQGLVAGDLTRPVPVGTAKFFIRVRVRGTD